MIVLAIESATELTGVAVVDEHGPRASVRATGRRRHNEVLAPAVEHVLAQAGVTLGGLDAVAVDVGPGLFTGLRVGVAMAKGLAQGLGVGIIAVDSLDILARAALDMGWSGEVVAVVDARRGEVFVSRYASNGSGVALQLTPPARCAPADMQAAARDAVAAGKRPVLAVGDGARRFAGLLAGIEGLTVAGSPLDGPPPETLGVVALERLAAGGVALPPAEVVPRYLRGADARIHWAQRPPVPPGDGA